MYFMIFIGLSEPEIPKVDIEYYDIIEGYYIDRINIEWLILSINTKWIVFLCEEKYQKVTNAGKIYDLRRF